jgi:hypothetical protein
MTSLVGTVPLRQVTTGKVVKAKIYDGISPEHLQNWEQKWKPVIAATQARLVGQGKPIAAIPQSSHWDWDMKAEEIRKLLSFRSFAIVCGGDTQGLMLVETVAHQSLMADEKGRTGQPLVYIDFLETAPWNRPEHVQFPAYRGVGQALIATAIQLSFDEGFKGRTGLHSLPQSEGFYRTVLKMTDFGPDQNYRGGRLRYFEFDTTGAQAFNHGGAS